MLARLLNIPRSPDEWSVWSFNHRDSHQRIRAAIQEKYGATLPDYQLDPIFPQDLQGWLQRNAQSHIDFDGVLELQSSDLLEVDFQNDGESQAWHNLHYQEHYNAELALGI